MTVNELITKLLSEMGEPTDGTGFWSRNDVLTAISDKQREITREARNLMTTTAAIDVSSSTTSITVDASGNIDDIQSAYRVYGGQTRPIAVYTEEQLTAYDYAWRTRAGALIRGVVTDLADEGKVRPYPIPDNSDNDLIISYLKLADEYTTELTEAGDASNQMTNWKLESITTGNSNNYVLYWSLSNSGATRTVSVYKAAAKLSGDLVAQGSRSGNGTLTLTEQNNSGVSGSVDVTFTIDDTDAANLLTMKTIEIPAIDIPCLKHGVKSQLYMYEKDGKDSAKMQMYQAFYDKELAAIQKRMRLKRDGTYRILQERGADMGIRTRPLYPWENLG